MLEILEIAWSCLNWIKFWFKLACLHVRNNAFFYLTENVLFCVMYVVNDKVISTKDGFQGHPDLSSNYSPACVEFDQNVSAS